MMSSSLATIDEGNQQYSHDNLAAATATTSSSMSKPPFEKRKVLSTKAADACLDWFIFPALLLIQFGATMYCHARQGNLDMNWMVVITVVLLFCLVAGIYRQILRQHPWESLVVLLLPELATNVLLALVMMTDLQIAFDVLCVMTAILMLVGAMAQFHMMRLNQLSTPQDYHLLLNDGSSSMEEDLQDIEDDWFC